jgi:hypothetical protein
MTLQFADGRQRLSRNGLDVVTIRARQCRVTQQTFRRKAIVLRQCRRNGADYLLRLAGSRGNSIPAAQVLSAVVTGLSRFNDFPLVPRRTALRADFHPQHVTLQG